MRADGIEEGYVDAAGIRARYLEAGRGTPVLLFHGGAIGSSADVWERNLAPLARHGLRPIALDLPGRGRTDSPLEFTEAYTRRFVLEVLDGLGIDRAGLVGHSSAGGLVIGLGFRHPERVTRIMVLGTGSLLPPDPADTGGGDDGPTNREPTIDDVRAVLEEQLYHRELITPEVVATRWEMRGQRPTAAQRAQARADRLAERGGGVPYWERLDQLPVPLLMLYGADDRPSTAACVARLKERHPALDIRLLPHCRHLIQWDAADEFVAAAGAFFRA